MIWTIDILLSQWRLHLYTGKIRSTEARQVFLISLLLPSLSIHQRIDISHYHRKMVVATFTRMDRFTNNVLQEWNIYIYLFTKTIVDILSASMCIGFLSIDN